MSTDPTALNERAPVIARQEVTVNAPLDRVWAIHLGVRDWPAWQTDIDRLTASADTLAPGVTFDWTTSGLEIHTTVYEVNGTAHETLWGGPAHGISAVHRWVFTPGAGGVRVYTEESWEGDPVRQDVAGMQGALDASLISWLNRLKSQAERHTLGR